MDELAAVGGGPLAVGVGRAEAVPAPALAAGPRLPVPGHGAVTARSRRAVAEAFFRRVGLPVGDGRLPSVGPGSGPASVCAQNACARMYTGCACKYVTQSARVQVRALNECVLCTLNACAGV